MKQSFEFCEARAREAAAEAKAATLANVRDRARRSAAAWRQMASLARSVAKERAERAQKEALV